jgi:glycosyltransferase involved in cell wall biosynthesis
MTSTPVSALVSVIIPCYNHGKFLAEAIKSVNQQTYSAIEIIVVDDGSTDITKEVILTFPQVKYLYQQNQGLSSARNAGIKSTKGEYLVFLDADDILFEEAVAVNLNYLMENNELAFVSGGYQLRTDQNEIIFKQKEVDSERSYLQLLRRNYIEMHATVMYRRFVFENFLYDTDLKACEDYDLYLKVARKFPVGHHSKILAEYRMHGNNMSGNPQLMLASVMKVLEKQKKNLQSNEEAIALEEGLEFNKNYYQSKLIKKFKNLDYDPDKESLDILKNYNKNFYFKFILKKKLRKIIKSRILKRNTPEFLKKLFFKYGLDNKYIPPAGNVDFGDFFRVDPINKNFGYERGGAIDRYYVEKFLINCSTHIKGRVLEVADNDYTLRFGKTLVKNSEILDIDTENPKATLIADLRNAPQILDNTYDCIILTQMLHMVYEYQEVINTCYRILKPEGYLLLTVPGISNIDYQKFGHFWHWSFTNRVIRKILAEVFQKDKIEVTSYGNVFTASAFLYGLGLPEIKRDMLDYYDPNMQVIISAQAQK